MDVRESIEGDGARIEAPRLGLLELEKGRRGRIPIALVGAILFHLLAGLSVVRLSVPRPAEQARARELAAQPTPVRVVFYETRPKPPEPPPPDTPIRSDRESRARSEIEPTERSPVRQPAATGESPHARKAAVLAPPPAAPAPPPRPAEAVTAKERDERPRPPDGDEITPTRSDLSPESRTAAGAGSQRGSAAGRFAGAALDSAIREQGFGNRSSGVSETGALEFDAKDFEWGPYARKIYEIVDRNWKSVIPLAARLPGVSGKVKLRFRIQKNGTVLALELLESSGRAALDQAALASIELSNPLPPLPPEFAREDVGVTFAYFYNLPVDSSP